MGTAKEQVVPMPPPFAVRGSSVCFPAAAIVCAAGKPKHQKGSIAKSWLDAGGTVMMLLVPNTFWCLLLSFHWQKYLCPSWRVKALPGLLVLWGIFWFSVPLWKWEHLSESLICLRPHLIKQICPSTLSGDSSEGVPHGAVAQQNPEAKRRLNESNWLSANPVKCCTIPPLLFCYQG